MAWGSTLTHWRAPAHQVPPLLPSQASHDGAKEGDLYGGPMWGARGLGWHGGSREAYTPCSTTILLPLQLVPLWAGGEPPK